MGICQFSHQKDMPVVALLHNNFLINMLKADYTEFIEQKLDLMSTVLFFSFPHKVLQRFADTAIQAKLVLNFVFSRALH
jgi:hypothetical protein